MKLVFSISRPTAQRRSSAVAVWTVAVLAVFILSIFLPSTTAANQKPVRSFTLDGQVMALDISADGQYLVVGTTEEVVSLFQKDSSYPIWSYTLPSMNEYSPHYIEDVKITESGEYYAVLTNQGVHYFTNTRSTPLWSFIPTEKNPHMFSTLAISNDGGYILAGAQDTYAYLFTRESNIPIWNYSAGFEFGNAILSVDMSGDGNYQALGMRNGMVYLFNKGTDYSYWSYNVSSQYAISDVQLGEVSLSDDGKYLAVTSTWQYDIFESMNKLYLFSTDSPTPLWNHTLADDGWENEISDDGTIILVPTAYQTIGLSGQKDIQVDLINKNKTFEMNYKLGDYPNFDTITALSGDGDYFVITYADKTSLFTHNSNSPIWTTSEVYGPVAISYDGSDIIVGSGDTLYLFDNVPNAKDEQQSTFSRINVFLLLLIIGIAVSIGGGAWMWKKRSMPPVGVSPPPSSPTPPSSFPPPRTPPTTAMAPMPTPMPTVSESLPETTTVTIECPSCRAQMKIPKLGQLQQVRCEACGTEGDVEV